MINLARVKRRTYFDSITLMKTARAISEMEGVIDVAAVMATPSNLELLAEAGLSPFIGIAGDPGDSDVLIVVQASDEAHAEAALEAAEAELLNTRQADTLATDGASETHHARQPRSLEEAGQMRPEANIAVISVPGMYAALEAQLALKAGLHVFLFSDNVSVKDEVALKRLGTERGLLVMGPDCGTARLNGVGLGFVNVVPDGPIGLVGASGTGMQQVMCLLAQAGYGVSQAIGCGGRDLSAEVGGATTLQGLRLLQEDEQTRVIVLISKPPAPAVAERVLAEAARGNKPVVVIFVSQYPQPGRSTGENSLPSFITTNDSHASRETPGDNPASNLYIGKVTIARTLTEAAQMAIALCETHSTRGTSPHSQDIHDAARVELHPTTYHPGQPPYLAALFSGGTLCDEALHLWGERLGPIYSNVALNPAWLWQEGQARQGHYALDLGADEYTRGRPHPMIDPEARLKYLRAAVIDPHTGVILLDIVLGYCAHPNPASIYAPVILQSLQQASQAGRRLNFVISLCGTENDPQQLSRQETSLRAAGAEIYTSNAEAAQRCLELLI